MDLKIKFDESESLVARSMRYVTDSMSSAVGVFSISLFFHLHFRSEIAYKVSMDPD